LRPGGPPYWSTAPVAAPCHRRGEDVIGPLRR
jgi:hypothetical protein